MERDEMVLLSVLSGTFDFVRSHKDMAPWQYRRYDWGMMGRENEA